MNATETQVEVSELWDYIAETEGLIAQYYGRIGTGKTYCATKDVLKLLSKGQVVYTNWKINYTGYDSRDHIWPVVLSLIMPWRKRFYIYPKDNLKHIEVDDQFIARFEKLTDCEVFLDEGHVVFDSYQMAKMSLRDRKAVLHTRHFDRAINIISQRPTAVHVSLRANVNIFYKCEKVLHIGPILLFKRTEYQDMVGETVDEEQPIKTRYYFARRSILTAYDSKYLRGDTPPSQKLHVEASDLNYLARISRFGRILRSFLPKGKKERKRLDTLLT